MRKRATQLELDQRYEAIEHLMDKGYSNASIKRVISQQFDISIRQAERDVKTVSQYRAQELTDTPTSELLGLLNKNARHIYRSALSKEDLGTALKSLEIQRRLIGQHQKSPEGRPNVQSSTGSNTISNGLIQILESLPPDQ